MPLQVILAPVGTTGDVFPFVAIALRLKERGHRVVVAASGGAARRRARSAPSGLRRPSVWPSSLASPSEGEDRAIVRAAVGQRNA